MMTKKDDITKIIDIFAEKYPQPETSLNYSNPFELLVAVILSAQTTDKQVNKVTNKLFKEYNTPEEFSRLSRQELQNKLKSVGLYRNKSKYIIETAKIIQNKHGGTIPRKLNDLMELPGVGKKTAAVFLACCSDKDTFPVDTHVYRVSKRLGLTRGQNVKEVENDLKDVIPQNHWINMHYWLINHGREVCKARNPQCDKCSLQDYCAYYTKQED